MSRKLYTVGVLSACLLHVALGRELARAAHLVPARPSKAPLDVRELVHGR